MPFSLARDALTLIEAAQFLRMTEKKIELAIIENALPCGVIARGWRGIALPNLIPGVEWKGGITSMAPREYSYIAYDAHGNELHRARVPEVEVVHFWYLDPAEAYDLLVMPKFRAGKVITFLCPHEGEEMHASVPDRWPAPPFTVWLNSEQEHDPLITRDDLLLLRADVNRFMAAGGESLQDAAAPRNHDDLTIGALALAPARAALPREVKPMKRSALILLMRRTYPETDSWFSRTGAGTIQEAAKLPQHGMWDAAAALAWAEARTARRAALDDWPAPGAD